MAQPLMWLILCAACGGSEGPTLTSATPASAQRGAMVTLAGEGLCDGDCATAAGEVLFGLGAPQVRAPLAAFADDAATIVVPDAADVGATEIVLSVRDRSSNALAFEVLP